MIDSGREHYGLCSPVKAEDDPSFAGGFQIIDETFEPIEAKLEKRPEQTDRQFKIQASYEPEQDLISFRGAAVAMTITAADLDRLPEEDREFIADLQDSLKRNY